MEEAVEQYLKIKENLLGIDIGYDSVKLVALSKNGPTNYLRSYNIIQISPRTIQQKTYEQEKVIEAINQAVRTARPKKTKGRLVVSGLPESKVFTKVIQMPKMEDDELKTAVPHEAARHIPIPPNELNLDWKNLGETQKKILDILVIAAPKIVIANYINIFQKANLELIALETKPIAAARAVIERDKQDTILILDIGAEATGISIFDGDNIKFTYTIPHGGNTLTKSIASDLKITHEEAEKMKRDVGLKEANHPEVKNAMQVVMDDIMEEVKNALKYFESRNNPPRKVNAIKIGGGGALTPGIDDFVAEKTNRKTSICNPFINVAPKTWRKIAKEDIMRLTTAIGLALRERF